MLPHADELYIHSSMFNSMLNTKHHIEDKSHSIERAYLHTPTKNHLITQTFNYLINTREIISYKYIRHPRPSLSAYE